MVKRRLDAREMQRAEQHEAYSRTATLVELYPEIIELKIEASFEPEDSWTHDPSPIEKLFSVSSKAFFWFECPHRECVSGGFDLSGAIREMVRSREGVTHGELVCQGWQDPERIGKNRCLLKMHYNIVAIYG